MISTPTVLVLGAGASVPYSLPTGPRLRKRVESIKTGSSICGVICDAFGMKDGELIAIVQEVVKHPAPSLDALLEQRPELDQPVRAMIGALMGMELQERLRSSVDYRKDWISLLVEKMRDGSGADPNDFQPANQGLTIVTFNFDSVVEERLVEAISRMYKDGSPEASKSIVAKIPIIHVHGRIPNPGKALTRDWLVEAVKNIRLIRDGVEKLEETVLDKVSLALQQAHVVAFLGFGFSRENIHRLGIPFSLETTQYRKHGPDVYASAFDVTPSDRIWISKKVPFVQFGEADEDCFAVLRRFPVFRD